VDSTIVSEAAAKIKEGIDQKNGKKLKNIVFPLMGYFLLVLRYLMLKVTLRKNLHFQKLF
jgi:hypothetical protein